MKGCLTENWNKTTIKRIMQLWQADWQEFLLSAEVFVEKHLEGEVKTVINPPSRSRGSFFCFFANWSPRTTRVVFVNAIPHTQHTLLAAKYLKKCFFEKRKKTSSRVPPTLQSEPFMSVLTQFLPPVAWPPRFGGFGHFAILNLSPVQLYTIYRYLNLLSAAVPVI